MADIVFISPHLDDAIYSCGGTIAKLVERGASVTIITVFAGEPNMKDLSPFAQELHDRWIGQGSLLTSPVQIRQLEDAAAAMRLGVDTMHLQFLDCIYRAHENATMYDSGEAIFKSVHYGDHDLPEDIANAINDSELLDGSTIVYGPLGLGNHVDHRACHEAVQLLGARTMYYEDYPYAETDRFEPPLGWQEHLEPVSQEHLSKRIEGIVAYKSQLETFWSDEADLASKINDRWMTMGGVERFWKTSPETQT